VGKSQGIELIFTVRAGKKKFTQTQFFFSHAHSNSAEHGLIENELPRQVGLH
jgi:hypothetical protein